MTMNYPIAAIALVVALALPPTSSAQDSEDLKKGVVKITAQVEGKQKVGTGFIVQLEKETAYIVTAAHVIEGDPGPQITFFTQPNKLFSAKVIGIEGGDPKGLAAVLVDGPLPPGLLPLFIDHTLQVAGGEPVMLIGFPGPLRTPWTVTTGSIGGLKGRELTFQAPVDEGNSGGPLLTKGKVVGVITEAREKYGYAVPAPMVQLALKSWQVRPAESPETVAKEIVGKDGAPMVLVRSGRLPTKIIAIYGNGTVEEVDAPPFNLYVADDFYVDKSLVTVGRFRQFLESTGHRVRGLYWALRDWPADQHQAIDMVSWYDAGAYCAWAKKRLPTEDEWEKAAHDMKGSILDPNVEEWTSSSYHESRFSPGDSSDQGKKTIRGSLSAFNVKVAEGSEVDYQVRKYATASNDEAGAGFRCAQAVK